jgi:GR25 family glycosyltransferase involved in LPS biosynthesis
MLVTDKHVRAWSAFLEASGDFLICFEDDAIFKKDSIERVQDLLAVVSNKDSAYPIYVDLAGGCELEELKIGNIETCRDALFRHYSKPVTNTACVYLMNRKLVTSFHHLITRRPWLRLIGIDWMMNKLFMLMTRDGAECICMHADPTIFKHGTTTGEYLSWQAEGTH